MTQPLVPDRSTSPQSASRFPAVPVGRQAHLMGIRWAIAVAMSAAVALVAGLMVAALWAAGFPVLKRDGTVTAGTLFELLKLVFAVVAGIGGVIALVVAYRRQKVTEAQNVLAHAADERAHAAEERAEAARLLAEASDGRAALESERSGSRLFNERYAKAAEQLGSDKAAVRLAGVYAMAGLADDWPGGRQTCIDVLCAYLRMPYTPPAADTDDQAAEQAGVTARAEWVKLQTRIREEQQVRHTLIRLIGAHLRDGGPVSWQGHDFDFTGTVFDGGDLSRVNFSGGRVVFAGTVFSGGRVDFAGATFSDGMVIFAGATFSDGIVDFTSTVFSGGAVYFGGATFSGGAVDFGGATFSAGRIAFAGARFSDGKVDFGAVFSGSSVDFGGAVFSGGTIDFTSAAFSNAVDLDLWEFPSGKVDFRGAVFSGGTVNLSQPLDWETRPVFDSWKDGPPAGLLLPG